MDCTPKAQLRKNISCTHTHTYIYIYYILYIYTHQPKLEISRKKHPGCYRSEICFCLAVCESHAARLFHWQKEHDQTGFGCRVVKMHPPNSSMFGYIWKLIQHVCDVSVKNIILQRLLGASHSFGKDDKFETVQTAWVHIRLQAKGGILWLRHSAGLILIAGHPS